MRKKDSQGFTLIELLIVIGIIGFLAAAVLVAVDPVKRIQDSRDARRASEVRSILNAVLKKQVDDRALYTGPAAVGMILSSTLSQVIVTNDTDIDCDDLTKKPACGVLTDETDGKGCVVNLGDVSFGLTGVATSSGTALVGTGTLFLTEVTVSDVLTDDDGGGSTCTVSIITDNTNIVCAGAPSPIFATDVMTNTPAGTVDSIVPTYISEIPIDPRGVGAASLCSNGTKTANCPNGSEGDLALGTQNSGYYLHRTTGSRLEIGACFPEQATAINVKR